MSIATLTIDINAKLASLERDMGRAANIAQRNADRMQRAFRGVARGLAGLGIGLSAGFVASVITGTAQAADALAKLSQKTGIAVEDLSRLQFAAELSGVSNEQLSGGLRKLSQNMADAASGTGEAVGAFEALGVAVKNNDGTLRSQQEVLRDVADRFKSYEDGAAKSALAQRIFGRAGAELIPLLNSGADGLKKMADESDRLGRTMSTETAKAAEQFNDNMTRLRAGLEGLKNLLAGPLIRALANFTNEMLRAAQQGETFLGVVERVLRGGVVGNRSDIAGAARDIERLTETYSALQKEIAPYESRGLTAPEYLQDRLGRVSAELKTAQDNYQAFAAELTKPVDAQAKLSAPVVSAGARAPAARSGGAATKAIDEQQRIFEGIQKQIQALSQQAEAFGLSGKQAALYQLRIQGANDAQLESASIILREIDILRERAGLQEQAKQIYEQTRTPIEVLNIELGNLNTLLQSGSLDWDTYARAVFAAQDRFDGLAEKAEETSDKIDTFADQAARNIQSSFANFLFNPFEDGLRGMLLNFSDTLRRMASELIASKLLNMLGGSLAGSGGPLGAFGASLLKVSGARASGGPVSGGSTYLVGERGPELFVPRNAGSIVPNNQMGAMQATPQNIRIVNTIDPAFVGDFMTSAEGERVIMNVVKRNASTMRQVVA